MVAPLALKVVWKLIGESVCWMAVPRHAEKEEPNSGPEPYDQELPDIYLVGRRPSSSSRFIVYRMRVFAAQ